MKKNGKTIKCLNCGKSIYFPKNRLLRNSRYCCRKCYDLDKRGIVPSNLIEARKKSPLQKGKCPFVFKGKNHWNWSENPSYRAVHQWLYQNYGNACKCENPKCIYPRKDKRGNLMSKPKQYQWANINGIYKRDIKNFKQLCASCHKLYDLGIIKL